jgi:hypothetical protein
MSNIRELNFDEIALVSGGNGADSADRDRALRAQRQARTSYGAQANGFQPNYAAGAAGANMYNDLSSNCGLAMVAGTSGLVGAVASRSTTGAISSIAGMIAGCKPDSNAASKNGPPFR